MKKIKLTQDKVAIVDDEDFERVNQFKWHAAKDGRRIKAMRKEYKNGVGRSVSMHRFILNLTDPIIQVDHINHDCLDNRKENLRICTNHQNRMNQRPYLGSSSVYKGVSWDWSRSNWISQIKFNNKNYNLGRFDSEREAALAYNAKAKKLFGEFAYLNSVEEMK